MFIILFVTIFLQILRLGNGIPTHVDSRIIGGDPTQINLFRFTAALNIQSDTMTWFCGGTLYGNHWIITAGQCVYEATLFTVRLGSAALTGPDDNRITLSTSIYSLHEGFNPLTLENDIGMIRLRTSVTYTDYIRSINYLALDELCVNTQVGALGWGQTSDEEGALSDSLQLVYVTTISNDECKITYGNQIQDGMVCVVGNYNEGACHGDTGSPLVRQYPENWVELVGISSFVSGNGCETPDPSGYTRVYSYLDWITWNLMNE